jgi:hypothetical protein
MPNYLTNIQTPTPAPHIDGENLIITLPKITYTVKISELRSIYSWIGKDHALATTYLFIYATTTENESPPYTLYKVPVGQGENNKLDVKLIQTLINRNPQIILNDRLTKYIKTGGFTAFTEYTEENLHKDDILRKRLIQGTKIGILIGVIIGISMVILKYINK